MASVDDKPIDVFSQTASGVSPTVGTRVIVPEFQMPVSSSAGAGSSFEQVMSSSVIVTNAVAFLIFIGKIFIKQTV